MGADARRDNARAGARLAFGELPSSRSTTSRRPTSCCRSTPTSWSPRTPRASATRGQFASRRRVDAEPDRLSRLYVGRGDAVGDRRQRRSPPAAQGQPDRGLRARGRRRRSAWPVRRRGAGRAPTPTSPPSPRIWPRTAARRWSSPARRSRRRARPRPRDQRTRSATPATTVDLPADARDRAERAARRAARSWSSDMNAGRVQMLLIVGESNPVYSAPADLKFGEALQKVQPRVHSGLFYDETAALCQWHVPGTHYLETWSDARSVDGTVSIVQPLIAAAVRRQVAARSHRRRCATAGAQRLRRGPRVLDGRGQGTPPAPRRWPHAAGRTRRTRRADRRAAAGHAAHLPRRPRRRRRPRQPPPSFEKAWRKWLHDGFIAGHAAAPRPVTLAAALRPPAWRAAAAVTGVEIIFRRDPSLYDGRFANNGWLQELPKPVTKLTWDNAALIAPAHRRAARRARTATCVDGAAHDGRTTAQCRPGSTRATPPDAITVAPRLRPPPRRPRRQRRRRSTPTRCAAATRRGSAAATCVKAGGDSSAREHPGPLVDRRPQPRPLGARSRSTRRNPKFAHEMEHMKLSDRADAVSDVGVPRATPGAWPST